MVMRQGAFPTGGADMARSRIGRETLKNMIEKISKSDLETMKQFFASLDAECLDIEDTVLKRAIKLESEHILKSRTDQRALHYIANIMDMLSGNRTGQLRDDTRYWKGYDQVITDSLWILGNRAKEGVHKGWYWGNFVPQIPFQLISRYTKPGDWVIDPFCGSGTTLIEAARLGRNSVGIDINPEMVNAAREALAEMPKGCPECKSLLFESDSRLIDIDRIRNDIGIEGFNLAILHPPYHNIIKFSGIDGDLSGARDTGQFMEWLGKSVDNVISAMLPNSFMGLVMGDMYRKGEVIPLGFMAMDALRSKGLSLKGIIVKDIQNNRAKRNSEALWRYRAIRGDFYVFKHEYIFVFKVPPGSSI
ncbi:MAG: DNA methyltransferase [Thermoplasmataceae archaeon]